MKIAIISDIHIKAPDGSNKFLWTDIEFNMYLHYLMEQVDEIFLNGDVFEIWKPWLPLFKFQKKEFEEILKHYPRTMRTIQENYTRIHVLIGNHDNSLTKLKSIYPEIRHAREAIVKVNSSRDLILVWHGHLDFWNRTAPWLGFFFTWISGIVERILFRSSKKYLGFAKFFKKPFFKNQTQVEFFKKEIDKYSHLVCMINGHTHHAQIIRFEYKGRERLYINSGYFNGMNQDLTIVDTETLQVISATTRERDFSYLKKKMQPGDIVLSYNTENVLSSVIAGASNSNYSHAFVYLGNNRIIESTVDSDFSGVQLNTIDRYLTGKYNLKILRIRHSDKIPAFIQFLESKLGIKYATGQLFIDAVYFLLKNLGIEINQNIDVAPNQVVCFELIAQGLMKLGYGIRPEKTVARDLEEMSDALDHIDCLTNN